MKKIFFAFLLPLLILSSCSREIDETFENFFFRNGNADLYVEINGNTTSNVFVIYLHGGPGGGALDYNTGYFSEKMEEDYAVVYLDQRGNGTSQGNNTVQDLTIAQNSEDIYSLAKVLRVKFGEDISIFLAGHSWGGLTSAHALIETDIQQILKGWIEIDGAHDFKKNDVETVKMFRTIGQEEILNGNNLNFWENVLERVNTIDTLNVSDEESGYLNGTGFQAEGMFDLSDEDGDALPAYNPLTAPDNSIPSTLADGVVNIILNDDSNQHELTNQLFKIEIPCLFLWGKYDFVVPPAMGQSAFELVNTEEKELIIYENSGHSPMSNEAVQFTSDVKEFIELYK